MSFVNIGQKIIRTDKDSKSITATKKRQNQARRLPSQSDTKQKRVRMESNQNGDTDISWKSSGEDIMEDTVMIDGSGNHHGTAFTKSYDQKVRPFIDLIDKLRTHGLDQDVRLPAIAVIGDQSAGKSSTLEAISGIQLPRGTGIVTRCALELRLKHTNVKGTWSGNIRYKTKEDKFVDKKLENAQQVGEEVRQAQELMTTNEKGISEELITLDIQSADTPDLTLIDLPGIARVAVGGQPSDIGKQIQRLITKYIKRQETIILAVIPCNVDIATTEALLMAEEMDSKKERTLGVLTKPDLIDRGGEGEILKILDNKSYPLDKGYTVVKCRGQLNVESNQSLCDAMKDEEDFFKNHDIFGELSAEQCGIKSLSYKLTEELVVQIKRTIPHLKVQVRQELEKTHENLKLMGKSPPETKREKTAVSLDMVRKYMEDLKNICRAEYSYVQMKHSEHSDSLRLRTYARQEFEKFGEKVKGFMPVSTNKYLRKQIIERISEQRGREMRNFIKYSIFEEFAKEFIMKAKKPAELMLKEIVKKQHELFEDLSSQYFSSYTSFHSEMKGIIYDYMKDVNKELEDEIDKLFEMEMHVYSQDLPYLSCFDEIVKNRMDKETEEKEKSNKTKTGSGLVVAFATSFANSLDGKSPEDAEADLLLDSLQSYFKVSCSRVADYVPLIIIHHLFVKCVKCLEEELYVKCVEDEIVNMVQEDITRQLKRDKLTRKAERLEIADHELSKF